MRANARAMADMLANLAELHTKVRSLAITRNIKQRGEEFDNIAKVCSEQFTGHNDQFNVSDDNLDSIGNNVEGIRIGLQIVATTISDLNRRFNAVGGPQVFGMSPQRQQRPQSLVRPPPKKCHKGRLTISCAFVIKCDTLQWF